jgi:hypothetical protein
MSPAIAVAKTFVIKPVAVTIVLDPFTAGLARQPYRPLSGRRDLMADEEHVKRLRQGVDAWNQWRKDTPNVIPDLSGANLRKATLNGANLRGANLIRATLRAAHLTRSDLSEANLSEANLNGANLIRANVIRANLNGALFLRADLRGARLIFADLSEAHLGNANLRRANLRGAILRQSKCEKVNFCSTTLHEACLINAILKGAKLDGARLWETQRAGWSIKGVICQSAYWDKEGKELTTYGPGEFERLYSEKLKVLVRYPDGMSPLEVVTLPALIQHLEASRPGCRLRFESIQDGPGGAVVTIVIEEAKDASPEQMALLRAAIQAEAKEKAQYLRQALESEKESVLLKGKVLSLEWTVKEILSRPTFYLERGDARMGDEYNVGQAGAVGPHSHAHDMTFNQVGGNIERSMDLSALAGELATLREAMSREAKEIGHYIAIGEVAKAEEAANAKDSSRMAQSLKAAGKWTLDVATKIGTSLATEALKESMGMK